MLWLLLASLLFLPVVMVRSLSAVSVAQMQQQAEEFSTLASDFRAYYADNVISRLQAADGKAVFSDKYRDVHGGIPIPATLSIELGALFDNAHADGRISYAFLSDYPFAKRDSRPLDGFELEALQAFRTQPDLPSFSNLTGDGLSRSTYRFATPILMRQACVTCHNSHPDSPKRDWKVGDVRGIQQVTVMGLQPDSFGSLGWLFGYIGLVGLTSVVAAGVFRVQGTMLERVNRNLVESNQKESSLAARLADQVQELSIFGSVVDRSVVGVSIADMHQPDQPLIYVNEAFTRITGYAKDLAIGYNCRCLQGPQTDPEEVQRIRDAIAEGRSYSGELLNYRLDGTLFWNRLTLYPVSLGSTDGTSPDFYVANQIDITTIREQASSPDAEAVRFPQQINQLEDVMREARRFAEALRARLADSVHGRTPEQEALWRYQQQAQARLEQALRAMQDALEGKRELP